MSSAFYPWDSSHASVATSTPLLLSSSCCHALAIAAPCYLDSKKNHRAPLESTKCCCPSQITKRPTSHLPLRFPWPTNKTSVFVSAFPSLNAVRDLFPCYYIAYIPPFFQERGVQCVNLNSTSSDRCSPVCLYAFLTTTIDKPSVIWNMVYTHTTNIWFSVPKGIGPCRFTIYFCQIHSATATEGDTSPYHFPQGTVLCRFFRTVKTVSPAISPHKLWRPTRNFKTEGIMKILFLIKRKSPKLKTV